MLSSEGPIIASCIQRHSAKWRTDSPLAEHTSMHGGNRGNWLESAPEPFLVSSNRTFWPQRYRLSRPVCSRAVAAGAK
jgi:hypothetical protein